MILVALFVVMIAIAPFFFTSRNLTNLAFQAAPLIVLAVGQLLVILARGIDLSVGSIVALASVTGALASAHGISDPLALGLVLVVGAAVGGVNGLILVFGRFPHPFLLTLGMLGIVRGIALLLSGGQPRLGQPSLFQSLGQDLFAGVPVSFISAVVIGTALWFMLTKVVWGRRIYLMGGNPEAARRAGIPVRSTTLSVYVLSGLAAACAGVFYAGSTNVGDPGAGQLAELDAIAAVMIGGASYLGGRGGVQNAVIGALTIAVVRNGLNLQGVTSYWEQIIIGSIVIGAVQLNVVRELIDTQLRATQSLTSTRISESRDPDIQIERTAT